MIKIAPSILAADLLRLGDQVRAAEEAGVDRFHVDIMDGRFVPNISLGVPVVEAMRRATARPIETHLMIEEPDRYLDTFAKAGADIVIVHQEAAPHLHRSIQHIKQLGKRAGVALNPATPVGALDETLEALDLLLIMTVNPGFGGQRFIDEMRGKIGRARALIDARRPACELEVDGGIDAKTAPLAVEAGARVLVAGTAVFAHAGGPAAGVRAIAEAVRAAAGPAR
jgi:ribulose-phosphate 3-epimerase